MMLDWAGELSWNTEFTSVAVLFSKHIIAPMSVETACMLELVTVMLASRKVSSAGFWFACGGITMTPVKD